MATQRRATTSLLQHLEHFSFRRLARITKETIICARYVGTEKATFG